MRNTLTRAGRTFVQSFLGVFISIGLLSRVVESGTLGDAATWQQALTSATAAGVVALVSFVQNWLEESKGVNLGPK